MNFGREVNVARHGLHCFRILKEIAELRVKNTPSLQ